MDLAKIGALIAARRRELGYTQETLGEALEVTGKAVSKWERGLSSPDIESLHRLAVTLKLNILSLLTGEPADPPRGSNDAPPYDESMARLPEEDPAVGLAPGSRAVSPLLFGTNFEHSRANIAGGISAQMLRNRKFAGKPSPRGCAAEWEPLGERAFFSLSAADAYTRHDPEHYHMVRQNERFSLKIVNASPGGVCGIEQGGLTVKGGEEYGFAAVVRVSRPIVLRVELTRGGEALCGGELALSGDGWTRYTLPLTPSSSGEATLRITFSDTARIIIGAVSLMPADNFRGMRRDVVERLRELGIKMLRWPGGNFSGEYNWFDGLLPVDERAPFASALGLETQPYTGGFDFHEINTDDFIALCRRIGAEPFITVNPAWCTPEENAAWVEYCNGSPDTPYGRLRAERGFPEPYGVRFWSLGNEFGYGHMEGDNTPFGYCELARDHIDAMRRAADGLVFCVCSPYPDKAWIDHVPNSLAGRADIVSTHLYLPANSPDDETPAALRANYLRCVKGVSRAKYVIKLLRSYLKPEIKISFDEWNLWEAWFRPSSVTEGMATALMLHFLICGAEDAGILISCQFEAGEGLIEVGGSGSRLTAAGQMFSAVSRHAGGVLLHASDRAVATLSDGRVTATLLNPDYDEPRDILLRTAERVKESTPNPDRGESRDVPLCTGNHAGEASPGPGYSGPRDVLLRTAGRVEEAAPGPGYSGPEDVPIKAGGANDRVMEATLYRGDDVLPGSRFSEEPLPLAADGDALRLTLPPRSAAVVVLDAGR